IEDLFFASLTPKAAPAYRPRSRPRAGQAGVKGEGLFWEYHGHRFILTWARLITYLLLDCLHLDEVGRPWNADGNSRNDDNAIPRFGHAQFLWDPFRSLEHIIRVLPVRNEDRMNTPAEIEPFDRGKVSAQGEDRLPGPEPRYHLGSTSRLRRCDNGRSLHFLCQ